MTEGKIASIQPWSGQMGDGVLDLSDRFVMPGLIDAHAHMALVVDERVDGGNYYVGATLSPNGGDVMF